MKTRVETLVYQAFSIYLGLNGSPSTTNSSSSRSHQQVSMSDGSFQHLSTPSTSRGKISSSGTRSTAARSQAYSMDVASSPPAISMAPRSLSQGHPTTMGPPFMAMAQMPAQNFGPNTMRSPLPTEQRRHRSFHSTMTNNLNGFPEGPFVNNGLAAGDSSWELLRDAENMNFNNTDANFYGGHPPHNLTPADYVGISSSPLQTLPDRAEDNTGNFANIRSFDQYHDAGNLRYNGTQ